MQCGSGRIFAAVANVKYFPLTLSLSLTLVLASHIGVLYFSGNPNMNNKVDPLSLPCFVTTTHPGVLIGTRWFWAKALLDQVKIQNAKPLEEHVNSAIQNVKTISILKGGLAI